MMLDAYGQTPASKVGGYFNLAVDESNFGQAVVDFDVAMTTPTAKVLGMETCPAGAAPSKYRCDVATHKCVADPMGTLDLKDCTTECGPVTPPPPPPAPPQCHAMLDIVLLLDGSASITDPHWQNALKFAEDLAAKFKIGPNDAKVGAIQFSSSVATISAMTTDAAALNSALASTRQMKMNTNTGAGFNAAKQMLDSQGRGAAVNASLVILVTDGKANMGPNPDTAAAAICAEAKHQVFGIGVGAGTDPAEIQGWVCPKSGSPPDHYFPSPDWSSVDTLLEKILDKACPKPPPPPADYFARVDALAAEARRLDETFGGPDDWKQCKWNRYFDDQGRLWVRAITGTANAPTTTRTSLSL